MKKQVLFPLLTTTLMMSGFSPLFAIPIGNSNLGREYYHDVSNLEQWSFGLFISSRDRLIIAAGKQHRMDSQRISGYVGYDFKPWFTTYGLIGNVETKIHPLSRLGGHAEYGVGMIFNLIDQDILSPTLFEDRIRVNATWQYTTSKTTSFGFVSKWRELFASLTVSIVNDLEGNRLFLPISMALFGGPIYSNLISTSFEEEDKFGFTVGLEVFFTDKVSVYLGTERLDAESVMGGINVRF